jgi:hypothetical protein
LKLGFSQAKGIWHYKYRSQGGEKKGGRLEKKNLKDKKNSGEDHYQKPKKKKKKDLQKEKGRCRNLEWQPLPPPPSFFVPAVLPLLPKPAKALPSHRNRSLTPTFKRPPFGLSLRN